MCLIHFNKSLMGFKVWNAKVLTRNLWQKIMQSIMGVEYLPQSAIWRYHIILIYMTQSITDESNKANIKIFEIFLHCFVLILSPLHNHMQLLVSWLVSILKHCYQCATKLEVSSCIFYLAGGAFFPLICVKYILLQ